MKEKRRSLAIQGGLASGIVLWALWWNRMPFTMLESLCLFRDVIPNLITRAQSSKRGTAKNCSDKWEKWSTL